MSSLTRYATAAALAAIWAWGAAHSEQPYDCGTDAECEAQCLENLQPDESPDVCAVSLAWTWGQR